MSVDSSGVTEASAEPIAPAEPASAGEHPSGSNADRPVRRIKIGSEREGEADVAKANPVTPGTPPPTAKPQAPKREPKHYPPPNVRDQLTPELEAEYAAAQARRVSSSDVRVSLPPVFAMTAARVPTASTTVPNNRTFSSSVSVGPSPVVPHTTSPVEP